MAPVYVGSAQATDRLLGHCYSLRGLKCIKVEFVVLVLAFARACKDYTIRLTAYTNYSLRTLMYCALHPGTIVRMEDIASAFGISKAHLLKSARQLGKLGYLKTTRGRTGGVQLGMAPERINIGAVVRALEGDSEVVECFNPSTNTCPLIGECQLTGIFHRGLEAFLAELDKVTLADVTHDSEALRQRLPSLAVA